MAAMGQAQYMLGNSEKTVEWTSKAQRGQSP